MAKALNFQDIILKLHEFWVAQGCVIWNPYNVQVGAGTGNPATLLRVLGPEPWRVAYVEPSVRPDDGRYGENPNRMQYYFQYQVILKPEPGNPQELYLASLEALGISQREHDIRFVEDNWESPALGAWGLGWEVWLDGQEITQFTYFQQAGGLNLDPVSVEITYGLERIALALQGKESAWDIEWLGELQYRDVFLQSEIEHCRYYFEIADIDGLKQVYDIYESESKRALAAGALIPSYDYVLKCSHLFNVLDTRGAIGVTERASYFRRMRDMTRNVAKAFAEQRQTMEYPLEKMASLWGVPDVQFNGSATLAAPTAPADVLFEIGVEELPAHDVDAALAQLRAAAATLFDDLRLAHDEVQVFGTPRRLTLQAKNVAPSQPDEELVVKGPPANRAFNADGTPTQAAIGFARGKGIDVSALRVETIDGGDYVTALVKQIGRPTIEVLAEALPKLIDGLKFNKVMRWHSNNAAFSRPVRWIAALYGEAVIPFQYATTLSGRSTRGLRPYGSPEIVLNHAGEYAPALAQQGVILDIDQRRESIRQQVEKLAAEVKGVVPDDADLLDEVANLVEAPTALRGTFEAKYLELPRDVLVTVMRKKQRYFAVEDKFGKLLPYFIAIRNGDAEHLDLVTHGNEHVLRARFSDASFFFAEDTKKRLEEHLPRLATLTFQEKLGSMLDKNERVARLVDPLGKLFDFDATEIAIAERAAHLAKADLATSMVVEMTSLQGIMGREYALRSGYPKEVAETIYEHWLPRSAGDALPQSASGTLLALADRLDSLVGLFAAGLAPTATSDPYGMRRAALGIVEILVAKGLDLDLRQAVELVAASQPLEVTPEAKAQVLEFIAGRLQAWLYEQGWSAGVIAAALAEQSANPYRAFVGVRELTEWINRPDWTQILDSFARCVRITRGEKQQYAIHSDLLLEAAEQDLFSAYTEADGKLDDNSNVDAFLNAFVSMLPYVTAFFDKVLVNTEDQTIRNNRIGLLQAIGSMQSGRADLSKLSGF